MRLTLRQIIDYLKCPMLYKFRWIDRVDVQAEAKAPERKWHMVEAYDKSLHNVIYGIFHQIADGKFPAPYYVKQRWGAVWNKGRTKEDIIFDTGSWRNEHRKREKQGLNALLALHSDFQKSHGTPILIGKEYLLPIGNHMISGVIDLVREVKEDERPIIEIVDFKSDDRPIALHIKGDLEVTAASYAFRTLFGYKEDRITYYGITSGKQTRAGRDERDYELMKLTIENVANALEQNIFYPVINSKCNECPFQKHCEKKEWF